MWRDCHADFATRDAVADCSADTYANGNTCSDRHAYANRNASACSTVLVLRETCDGSANAGSAASVSFTGDIPGYDFVVYGPGFNGGWDGAITADAHGDGTTGDLTAGSYEFTNSSGGSPGTPGSFTISTCAPSVRVTACDHAGTASGGAIAWTEPGYSTLTITGPAPSTAHFTLAASAGQYGPLTAGAYSYTFNVFKTSVGGTFTIPACTGIATG